MCDKFVWVGRQVPFLSKSNINECWFDLIADKSVLDHGHRTSGLDFAPRGWAQLWPFLFSANLSRIMPKAGFLFLWPLKPQNVGPLAAGIEPNTICSWIEPSVQQSNAILTPAFQASEQFIVHLAALMSLEFSAPEIASHSTCHGFESDFW